MDLEARRTGDLEGRRQMTLRHAALPQGPRGTGPDYLANGPFNFCSLIQYFPGRGLISHIHPGLVHGIEQEAIQSRSGVDRVPT